MRYSIITLLMYLTIASLFCVANLNKRELHRHLFGSPDEIVISQGYPLTYANFVAVDDKFGIPVIDDTATSFQFGAFAINILTIIFATLGLTAILSNLFAIFRHYVRLHFEMKTLDKLLN